MTNEVVVWIGAGQIGMAIARRIGYGKKIVVGDKNVRNAEIIAQIMEEAGFDVVAMEADLASRESIHHRIGFPYRQRCHSQLLLWPFAP